MEGPSRLSYDRTHVLSIQAVLIAGKLTLVLGGARSGKSAYAEALLRRRPPPWIYIATAQPWDAEMTARIERHRADRGEPWTTVEAPIDLPRALRAVSGRPVLVDCLTLWLSNVMLADDDVDRAFTELETAIAGRDATTVAVSNEVGLSIVPDNALARAFRDHAGRLHQRLAAAADHVVFVVAGLPMVLKGSYE